ncbi:AI-2E family transporter [Methylocapsa polymorpha]|uniref:AI-2E family transporter n=1 Tax=Methylocapsa polymorpha TaxID=3080828 RepID=A0ABZ0HPR2_9HYPH|nr:AI-2E family transporter [Methylocapsa sp. RX1]
MRLEWQIGFWVGVLLLLILLLWVFSGVLLPFAAAVALGYLLNPVADRLERLGLSRLGATLLIMVGFVLLLVVALVLIVPILGRQLVAFIEVLPSYVFKLEQLISSESERFGREYGGAILQKLGLSAQTGADLRTSTTDLLVQAAQWAASFLKSVWTNGAALVSVISLIIVTPVVAFYMLLDWEKMIATIDGLVPLRYRDTVRELAREIDAAMAGFLRGQSLVCLFLGAWYGIGLTLIGLNFGLLIGITAGLLSFIPYVGSLTALVLSSAVAIVQDWPQWKLLFMALGVFLTGQFLEGNILSPKLVGDSVGLHPVWLIFALLAFGSLFGFTGLITAVPLAAAAGVVLRFAVRRYRESAIFTELPSTRPKIFIEATVINPEKDR